MAVNWGFAGQIGGVSFGLVFAILIILALAIWIIGLIINKIGANKAEASDKKEGD